MRGLQWEKEKDMAEKSEVRKKTGHRTVEKKLLSSQIEEAFTQYIMTECRVGDRLPNEFLLAEKFGTSRATIRAVIRTLVSEGIDSNYLDIINYAVFGVIKLS